MMILGGWLDVEFSYLSDASPFGGLNLAPCFPSHIEIGKSLE
jgi:hypothetical protein